MRKIKINKSDECIKIDRDSGMGQLATRMVKNGPALTTIKYWMF